ncbi:hypothetical protein N7540_010766 [Penicillium herquei]|nr:hypothetical protein N7540_010766 [Penicillium herquei]
MLRQQHGISESTIQNDLRIVQGEATDIITVRIKGMAKKRDPPFAMMPLYYHRMRKEPHKDKQGIETLIMREFEQPANEPVISDYLVIRPSLLTEGDGDGMHKIKEGTANNPAIGYMIARSVVGLWMFERVVSKYRLKLSQNSPLGAKVITIAA